MVAIILQKTNGGMDVLHEELIHSLSSDGLSSYFHFVGSQMLYLWNLILNLLRFVFDYSISRFI